MAHNLRPGLLEELGLTKAVRATVEKAAQASGLAMAADLEEVDGLLPPEFEVNLFRIIQEALSNVARHSHARKVDLSLDFSKSKVDLIIRDNGTGFDKATRMNGIGLQSMQERARMINGRLTITTAPGQGTVIHLTVPHRRSKIKVTG